MQERIPHGDLPSPGEVWGPMRREARVLDGRYRLRRLIGRGELADVFLGDDLFLERAVTIKIPHDRVVGDASQLEQFRREAISLAAIRAPNIVSIYDLGLRGQGVYLVMQHVEGRTIEEEIRRFGPMTEVRATAVLVQLLAGLAAMHARGVVHGDVRSSNVLLARNGNVVLLDLGIVVDHRRSRATVVGNCASSDSRESRAIAPRALTGDVYHVGGIMLYMLTGVDAARRSQRSGLEDLLRRLPPRLVGLARRALDTDPAERYPSATAMKAALDAARETAPVSSTCASDLLNRDRPTTTMTAGQLLSLLPDTIPTAVPAPWAGGTRPVEVGRLVSRRTASPTARLEGGLVLVVDADDVAAAKVKCLLERSHRVAVLDVAQAEAQISEGARFSVILCGLASPISFHHAVAMASPEQADKIVFLIDDVPAPETRRFLDRVTNTRLSRPLDPTLLQSLIAQKISCSRRAITSRG